MMDTITITKNEFENKCAELIHEFMTITTETAGNDLRLLMHGMILASFSARLVIRVFDDEEHGDEENVSVNN